MQSGIKQNDDLNTEIYEYEQLADIGDIADIGDGGDVGGNGDGD